MIEVHDIFASSRTDNDVIYDWAFMAKQSHVDFLVQTYCLERAIKMLRDGTLPAMGNIRIVVTTSHLARVKTIKNKNEEEGQSDD